MDEKPIAVTDIKISGDHKKVSLTLATLQQGYVYQLNLGDIKTESGDSLDNKIICYTVKRLRDDDVK
jgi:hypothetical protein